MVSKREDDLVFRRRALIDWMAEHSTITRDDLEERVMELDDRESEILKLCLNVGSGYDFTLKEVGYIFKLTEEQIQRIKDRALAKLGISL